MGFDMKNSFSIFVIMTALTPALFAQYAPETYYHYSPEHAYGLAESVPVPLSAPHAAATHTPQIPNASGCVLMKNRSVLEGTVTDAGDNLTILLSGGSITVAKSQVWTVGRDHNALYTFLRSQIHPSDTNDRSELVRWCLKYELVDEASAEIDVLEKITPDSPMIGVLKMRRDATQRMLVARQVETSVFSGENARPEPVSPHERGPSSAELKQMAKTLPSDAVVMFGQKIQPLLTKNCMTSGCHGPDGNSDFRLLRPSSTAGGTVTLRNMHAALQQINLNNPEASPLLRKPVTRHGKDARVVFINRDYATYQLLIAWTYLVAKNEYVIPRERMVPTIKQTPVMTSTSAGLQSVTSYQRQGGEYVSAMFGVDASLYPQHLYPSEYSSVYGNHAARENPASRFQKQKTGDGVIPAGAEMPVSQDEIAPDEAFYDVNVKPTAWEEAMNATCDGDEEEYAIKVFQVINNGQPEFVQERNLYTPENPGGNLNYGEMGKALMPTHQPNTRPLSPMEMLLSAEGVSNYSENEFQYTEEYGQDLRQQQQERKASENPATPRNENRQQGFHPWKDGLEIQRVMENMPKTETPEQ